MASYQLTVENLIGTGAHFGHLTSRRHPKYAPFIYTEKNGIHIIDIQQTIERLQAACDMVTGVVRKSGTVLFVGTKKQAKDVLQQEADRCGMFYVVERWLGGTLTNYSTIKKSIKRLVQLEKDADTLYQSLTKKEILKLERERIRLSDQHRGIKDMRTLPDVIFVVDAQYELTAVKEARRLEIPIIGIVDSNTDPTLVDYPIPANDDSLRAIQLITGTLADAILSARGGVATEAPTENQEEPAKKVTAVPEKKVKAAPEKKTAAVPEKKTTPVKKAAPKKKIKASDEGSSKKAAPAAKGK